MHSARLSPLQGGTPDGTAVQPGTGAGEADASRLAAENVRLTALLERSRRSARLHALRANSLRNELDIGQALLKRISSSTSWRLTFPLRAGIMLLRAGLSFTRRCIRWGTRRGSGDAGPAQPAQPVAHWFHGHLAPPEVDAAYLVPPTRPAPAVLAPRILIIAELSIPQCSKYRVWQKQEHLARLGFAATVVDWRETWQCISAIQLHARVILYRVPATPTVRGMLLEAARLGIETSWEVDDLIFDEALYVGNRNLTTLDEALRREVLSGVAGYRAGLLACDGGIASTAPLAEAMRRVTAGPVAVVENALDVETLDTAAALHAARQPRGDDTIIIAYGSGTKTHDVDFLEAADALAELMRQRPAVRLRIMGELTLPSELDAFGNRIERIERTEFRTYLGRLAEADISIAPLEPGPFNDAKSNIKFLEAAILGLPAVCSPRTCFQTVVEDGRTGLLADGTGAWLAALLRLVDDPALRRRIGDAAREAVLDRYAPESVAVRQVLPLVQTLDRRPPGKLRVLIVNVFYAPKTYGGATIVAEELARQMAARPDTEVMVFTTHALPDHPAGGLFRYEIDGIPVIAAHHPPPGDLILDFDNPMMADVFRSVLLAADPSVVHFHCVQQISASCADACREAGIPYAVTLHDAWWLCQRQFMVRADKRYCGQWRIDLRLCEACIPGVFHLRDRFTALEATLDGAAVLTAPSEFHRQLHVANGHAADRVVVNRNGVRPPARLRPPRPPGPLRFGYVGGNEAVKGSHVVRASFEGLQASDYELVLVDNTLKIGFSTWEEQDWKIAGTLRIVPAYDYDEMDAFFASIDVLLFPSQWKESFGLTVREAMLRDVWVIVSDGGGASEDVADGVNGTVIPMTDDPVPLRSAVAALLADPARIASYRNPLKDRITTFGEQAAQMWQLLAQAAAGRQTTRFSDQSVINQ